MSSEKELENSEISNTETATEAAEEKTSDTPNKDSETSENQEQTLVKTGPKVFYLGEDESYWSELKKNFQKDYASLNLEYEILYDVNPSKNQHFITYMMTNNARIIFVDLSKFGELMLHLLSNLVRLNAINQPVIIGLMDYTTPRNMINKAIMTGVSLVHIKSSEYDAVIYDSIYLAFNQSLNPHNYATAKLDDYLVAYVPCKLGLMTSMGARIESKFKLNEGAKYLFHNFWTNEKIIAAPNVVCANQYQYDLYYNFEYAQELGFEMVPPEEAEDSAEDKKKRKELFTDCRLRMESWVQSNQGLSISKKLKVLVIDKTLSFYENDTRTDSYSYLIHCQPFLKFVKKELLHEFAQLIVFNMEDISVEEKNANEDIAYSFNDQDTLQYIVKSIRAINQYEPYIIVFNSVKFDSNYLQKMLNYKNIISLNEDITPELVIKMAQMLEQKLSSSIEEFDVPLIVLPKTNLKSYGEFEISIKVHAASESDIYFSSDFELSVGTVIRIHLQGDLHVTVVPSPANNKYPECYYGLIHSVNESDKMEIRRWINQIFFRQLEEKKEAEREEILRIKEEYIERKKREAEEAKRQEEAEAERKRLEEEEEERLRQEQKDEQDSKAQKLADNDQKNHQEKEDMKIINQQKQDPDVIKDGGKEE